MPVSVSNVSNAREGGGGDEEAGVRLNALLERGAGPAQRTALDREQRGGLDHQLSGKGPHCGHPIWHFKETRHLCRRTDSVRYFLQNMLNVASKWDR